MNIAGYDCCILVFFVSGIERFEKCNYSVANFSLSSLIGNIRINEAERPGIYDKRKKISSPREITVQMTKILPTILTPKLLTGRARMPVPKLGDETRNVCETRMPPLSLNVTLTFDLETPNSIGSSTSHDQPPYQVRRSLGYEFFSY